MSYKIKIVIVTKKPKLNPKGLDVIIRFDNDRKASEEAKEAVVKFLIRESYRKSTLEKNHQF